MNETSRFALPFILPGQAQKELFHNEALARLDIALHPAVEGAPLAVPPLAPSPGQAWIIAAGASGDWSGKDGAIASWTEGGWRFLLPTSGMSVWNKDMGLLLHFDAGTWSGDVAATKIVIEGQQVLGPRQPAVPSPSGGTTIDAEARAAIAAIAAALMSHGLIE